MMHRRQNRDVIAIGASAGGVKALATLMSHLPADLPAAVFIVQHVGQTSYLASILDAAGPLPVAEAVRGEMVVPGRVYVAPPGLRLMLHDGHVLLRRGPHENLARPAVDPLFRSAASSFGPRVTGVVLTGALSDGTAGLRAIKQCGGMAVVQDPLDAAVPDMPANACRHVDVDHCVPLADLGALLARLSSEEAGPAVDVPERIRLEVAIAAQELMDMATEDRLGSRSRFTCPECNGTLWEIEDDDLLRYRCHVGHAFTADALMVSQGDANEQMLWSLLRSHRERAELARQMAERTDSADLAQDMQRRALQYDENAELLRRILRDISRGADGPQDRPA
ncbi:MAG: chemotaxis protein CheB [Acetobacterales bacterium]